MPPVCFSCDNFHLQAKVSPLKIALGEIFFKKSRGKGLEKEFPERKIFEKFISGRHLLGTQEMIHCIGSKLLCYILLKIQSTLKMK